MRMGTFVLASVCMHMLLWACCHSASDLDILKSHERSLKQGSTNIYRNSLRKLLEDKNGTLTEGAERTSDASVNTEPKTTDEKGSSTHFKESTDVEDLSKDNVSVEENVKLEETQRSATSSPTQFEDGASEAYVSTNNTDKLKGEEAAAIAAVQKVTGMNNTDGSKNEDAGKYNTTDEVDEPESKANEGTSTDERPKDSTLTAEETMEALKVEPQVNSEAAQFEARPSSDGDDESLASEQAMVVEAVNKTEGVRIELTASQSNSNEVDKRGNPESEANQDVLKGERSNVITLTKEDSLDAPKTERDVNSEAAQVEVRPTTISDGNKSNTTERLITSVDIDHNSMEKNEDTESAGAQSMEANFLNKNELVDVLSKNTTEVHPPTAFTENDLHTKDSQTDETPVELGLTKPLDNSEQENSTENGDSKKDLAEDNPIKMVADLDDDNVTATTLQLEVLNDNVQTAVENEKNVDNFNGSSEGSHEEMKNEENFEDRRIEEKTEKAEDTKIEGETVFTVSLEENEETPQNNSDLTFQVQDQQVVEKMKDADQSDRDQQNESNKTESIDTDVAESQGLRDDGTENDDRKDTSVIVRSDDEAEAAREEVEMQLEALKRDTVIETSVDQMHEMDPSEDEYDIIHELTDLPSKFQETAGKVADRLRPGVIKWTDTSKVYFNRANKQMTESLSPLLGKQYAPFLASLISYGIFLLPLLVVILLFDHIKALFSLQKVLLFINIYLAAYFATLWLASFIIGLEPMSFFYLNSLSSFLSLQLLQGLGYLIYLFLQTANMIHSCTTDTLVGKVNSTFQWTVAMAIGLHYYVTVFHPAVVSKPPRTSWKFYAMYAAAFFVLCLFARIRWVKKQYMTSGNDIGDKKS